jgi:hypothetical protein
MIGRCAPIEQYARMRLVMTLLVRDEQELLAANLDYHLRQGVDFVLVSDHGSTDATPEILADYVQRGVARVLAVEGEALDQGAWVTHMARLAAAEHGADWVINNDSDEFWWPLAGTLPDMLSLVPPRYGQLVAPRNNFIPRPGTGPFWERMVVREAHSQNLIGGELEPNVAHRGYPDIVVDHGNHWVHDAPLETAPAFPLIEVLHFPIRTYEQFEHKVVRAGRGYQALADRPPDVGRDQLTLYEIHQQGGLPDYFSRAMLDDEGIEAGLARGELVLDRRLERFLSADPKATVPGGPELVAVSRLAGEAFALAEDLTDRERALGDARGQLEEVSRELEALRGSRLVRWTAPARRAYYRARGKPS